MIMTSFFAWNTRGFNQMRKQNHVRSWLHSSVPSFGCLLETRVQEVNCPPIVDSVFQGWNHISNYDYHRLGRIWFLWSDAVSITPLYKSPQIITVWVSSVLGEEFICSCVYASTFQADRVLLWEEIRHNRDLFCRQGIPWILLGDFNETLASDEHSRSFDVWRNQSGMRAFQSLVSDCDLTDLDYSGPKFTWWNNRDADPIGKKLDRVLVNSCWCSRFPLSSAVFETTGVSDHTRSVTRLSNELPVKRRHFQFFNYLTAHPQFIEVVSQCWSATPPLFCSRSALHRFHKKLKSLKPALRALNRERYGDITTKTRLAFEVLRDCQNQALLHPSTETFAAASEASATWHHLADVEEQFFHQKSRITWMNHGDRNTTFFHRTVQARHGRNSIKSLLTATGFTITDPTDIKAEAVNHFKEFLNEQSDHNTIFGVENLRDLIEYHCPLEAAALLIKPFTDAEIKQVLFSMPANKAPGPDGYTAEFYKAAWPIIGPDFLVSVKSFFMTGFMPHGVNATILSLVPKSTEAKSIKDYRPIACCNMLYKVISKLLANRLKMVLPEAMVPNQSAFIKGRLLLENVLLATELVKDYHKQGISPRCAFKLDISKAFDAVRWDFIMSTLQAMGFPVLFISWIKTCISTATFSVCINGALEGFFSSSRGLRQGCSLSPYLFVIAINVLSHLLDRAAIDGKIGYHPYCRDLNLTHLSFADDMMIFLDGTPSSLRETVVVLDLFAHASGLAINPTKSSLYTAGLLSTSLTASAQDMGISLEALPIRYLGLPLTTKSMTRLDYEPLIDKIRKRMLSWSIKTLSYAGRLQLIQSVITSIANFWCSAFRLPKRCFDLIESMCSAFLWSGSPNITTKAKVRWEDVCLPKHEGGLGVRKLVDTSRVFALRLIWRLHENSGSLWVAWTRHYLLRHSTFWDAVAGSRGSWIWKKLLKLRPLALGFLCVKVRDGASTSFWFDNWLDIGRPIDIAGEQGTQVLGIHRAASVSEAANSHGWTIRRTRSRTLHALLHAIRLTPPPRVDAGPDQFLWKHGAGVYKAHFSSKMTWNQVRIPKPMVRWHKVMWFAQSIPRHAFITWLAILNKLSTGDRMRRWGTVQFCPLCGDRNETRDHLFFACPFSYTVWTSLCSTLLNRKINPDWNITLRSLTNFHGNQVDYLLVRLTLQASIYFIWRERNDRIHNKPWHSPLHTAQTIAKIIRTRLCSLHPQQTAEVNDLLRRWNVVCTIN